MITPYIDEFELGLVGAICIEPKLIPSLAAAVDEGDFVNSLCARVFATAADANARGKAFDAVIAADCVSKLTNDSVQFIKTCINFCPSTVNATLYASEIRKASERRRISNAVRELLDDPGDIDLATEIAAICSDAIQKRPTRRSCTIGDALADTYNQMFEPEQGRIDTGFQRLDAIVKGMHAGELIVIGARPAVGKSAFALSIAVSAASVGHKTLLCSLEMQRDEIAERLIVQRARNFDLDAVIDRKLNTAQAQEITRISSDLYALPLCICDAPNLSVSGIRAEALTTPGLGLIVVDYIGLLHPEKRNDNRNLELGQISRDLKCLASELHIPIVALAQLNRGKEETERPSLRDLRDSGEIEQNASKVLFLWRSMDGVTACSVAKNRRGRLGVVQFDFDGAHMTFKENGIPYTEPKRKNHVFD